MKADRKFQEEINIDQYKLDQECATNGERVIFWGGKWAEACTERDKAKKKWEEYKGELELKIRRSPEEYRVIKVTDNSVDAAVWDDEKCQILQDKYIDANELATKLQLVKDAFLQRKDLLLAEIKLFLANYYHTEERLGLSTEDEMKDGVRMKRKNRG